MRGSVNSPRPLLLARDHTESGSRIYIWSQTRDIFNECLKQQLLPQQIFIQKEVTGRRLIFV